MRVSQFFISTLKEAPSEAELPSHRLMLRAGYIRKLASGLYTWMPMACILARLVAAIYIIGTIDHCSSVRQIETCGKLLPIMISGYC